MSARPTLQLSAWLTVRDAARLRGVTVATIHRWIAEGLLPAARAGWTWLVRRDAVEAVRPAPRGRPRGARLVSTGDGRRVLVAPGGARRGSVGQGPGPAKSGPQEGA